MADGGMETVAVPTALYRHFDKDGALLYVGISLNHMARLAQHRDASHWFPHIARMTVEWLPDRAAAMEAERLAILNENPAHNVKRPRKPDSSEVAARIDDSRWMLNRKMVAYKPLYKLQDAAKEIGISASKLRLAGEHGELRLIRDNGRVYITGWALVDYMEALEAAVEAEARICVAAIF